MAIREAWWKPYETTRTDCQVTVNRWGDGVRYGGATWRAIHAATGTRAYVSFDRIVPDADALAQLFQVLHARLARAAADPTRPYVVRRQTGTGAGGASAAET